jgi:hypothetical protein
MEFSGWDIIITLIIASYGALVSTISIWYTRKEHKREVKVKLNLGFIQQVSLSPAMLILTALNTGTKTATLSAMGLILPKKKILAFTHPNSYVTFPHDLLEGKDVVVWIKAEELAQDLIKNGFSGSISFKGFYRDALGKEYKSKTMEFNLYEWSKDG